MRVASGGVDSKTATGPALCRCFSLTILLLASALLAAACRDVDHGIGQESPPAFVPQLPTFTDVSEEVGLQFHNGAFRWDAFDDPVAMMGGGLCWLDYDRDGRLDLYVVNNYALDEAGRLQQEEGGLPHNVLFRNNEGQFSEISAAAGADLALRGTGCVAADFNNDTFSDLYISGEQENALLWNNGDGTFKEGAEAAGVNSPGWQTAAAVADLNEDGWLDLFVAGYAGTETLESHSGISGHDLLYLNQGPDREGQITFREVGTAAGLEADWLDHSLGALFSDLDQDGDLDLLIANSSGRNRLYEYVSWPGAAANDPQGLGFRLVEVGHFAGIDAAGSSAGVSSGDFDGDGRLDILFTSTSPQPLPIYQNLSPEQPLVFDDDQKLKAGAGWGAGWADFDHDTDLDLFIAGGALPVTDTVDDRRQVQFFANLTAQGLPGRMQELTPQALLDPLLARGSALADYDNDGDLDVAISTVGGPLVLLRNEEEGGGWLTVTLDPFQPGALVTAVLPGGQQLLCETRAGGSYLSSEDPRCHFGLGAAGELAGLVVRWPDGRHTRLENIAANQFITISQADAEPAPPPAEAEKYVDAAEFEFQLSLKRGGAEPLTILDPGSPELIRLGEALFWDRELGGNRDMACATCHHPAAGTGDGLSVSVGTGGKGFAAKRLPGEGRQLIPRNATELFNLGAAGWDTMFWDGRVGGSKEDYFHSPAGEALPLDLDSVIAVQAMFPVTSRDEMRGQEGDLDVFGRPNELATISDDEPRAIWRALTDRLLAIPAYQELFAAAYPQVAPERLRFQHAANAIAAYEMSVFTYNDSPWDRYLAGDETALNEAARRGAALFYGEAGCARCHSGPLLTDQYFHNIGVPQLGPGKNDEAGFDYGRLLESKQETDMYAFRTPSLHNVTVSGPWMHNGAYTSLEAAVRHHLDPAAALENYNALDLHPMLWASYKVPGDLLATLDPLLAEPAALNDAQVADLLAFLETLTAPAALQDGCDLIPDSVPSGLPVDRDPARDC
ncbi:MAG: cytochrome c peroxidase [Candidatus Promineifilaceae bacterium]